MKYRLMTENDLEYVVEKNNEYYNNVEGCWTYEKAGTIKTTRFHLFYSRLYIK